MKTSKAILLSTVCLFGYAEGAYSANYPAWEASSLISTSGIHTYHTHNTLTDEFLFSPHAQFSNKQRHSRRSEATSGNPGKAKDSIFDLDVRIKSEHDIRVASVCFITDTGACAGGDKFSETEDPGSGDGKPDYKGPQDQCIEAGYDKHPCPAGSHGDNLCPLDSSYAKGCTCDDNMTETCEPPYYGVGPSCDGKYARCEKDTARACRDLGYSQSGSCPALQTPNERCPYDNSYYDKCVCRSDLVTCSSPLVGVGSSCGGKYESCQCPGSYRECECGGASGASSCTINGVTKYSSCKACCDSNNPNWCDVHRTCHGDCCSDGTIERCDTRCGGSGCCTPKSNETGCQYGTYACDNGCGGSRLCCKVCDPEDRYCQCPGYVYCGTTKTGSGASCTSGGKTFYETCLVKETCIEGTVVAGGRGVIYKNHPSYTRVREYCTTLKGEILYLYAPCQGSVEGYYGKCFGKRLCSGDLGHQSDGSTLPCVCDGQKWFDVCDDACNFDSLTINGGSCRASVSNPPDYYYVKEKCIMSTGDVVSYYGSCTGVDCNGKKGPCYGKIMCSNGTTAVNPCECGRKIYGSSCVIKCPYEQTAADCKAGQSFTQRCKDNAGTWYGECK